MIPTSTPHPLKSEIKKARLRLWQLKLAIGISDAHICRMLNGIVPMTEEVETGIRHLLDEVKQPLVNCK
jgi:hypothetical protein